jgi:hypothetical protein
MAASTASRTSPTPWRKAAPGVVGNRNSGAGSGKIQCPNLTQTRVSAIETTAKTLQTDAGSIA